MRLDGRSYDHHLVQHVEPERRTEGNGEGGNQPSRNGSKNKPYIVRPESAADFVEPCYMSCGARDTLGATDTHLAPA